MVDLRIRSLQRAFKRRSKDLRRQLYARWVAGPRLARRRDYLMVLNLHQVSPVFAPGINLPGCWTGVERFKSLLAEVQRRFRIVALPAALRDLRAGTLKGECLALTLDDGHRSIETHVVPILTQERIPATFFINTACLGTGTGSWQFLHNYWDHRSPLSQEGSPLRELDGVNVRELRNTGDSRVYNRGREAMERLGPMELAEPVWVSMPFLKGLDPGLFSVGLHGHEHQRFSMMSAAWQKRDLMTNRAQLADLPCYAPLFAIPFGRDGDWSASTRAIAEELGLTVLLAAGGVNDASSDVIRRIPSDNLRLFEILCRA